MPIARRIRGIIVVFTLAAGLILTTACGSSGSGNAHSRTQSSPHYSVFNNSSDFYAQYSRSQRSIQDTHYWLDYSKAHSMCSVYSPSYTTYTC